MLNGRKIVALCTSRLNDPENSRFVAELNEFLRTDQTSLFIYNINTDLYWNDDELRAEASVFSLIDFSVTDAVVIMHEKIKSEKVTQQLIDRANETGTPVIIIDTQREGCVNIGFDYAKGFEKVVSHVIEDHGVKNSVMIAGFKGNSYSEDRIAVFKNVLERNGLTFSDDLLYYGNFWAKPASEAAEQIIASGKIPQAVICANDIMAINVCSVFQEHGYRVPEDIIVTGFDGIDEINYSSPKLTSCYCGSAALCGAVHEALKEALNGRFKPSSRLVEPTLILSDSCGCRHTGDTITVNRLRSFNDRFYRYQDDNMVLTDISDRILAARNLFDAACLMFTDVIQDLCIMINKSVTDKTHNYFSAKPYDYFEDDMLLFFQTGVENFRQRPMKKSMIAPDIEKLMEPGYPLIFNVLSFLNVPLGYMCSHFNDYDIINYTKIPIVVSTISGGLGGFLNMQYQQYLISRIEDMYRLDHLTGLYNRQSFSREFDKQMKLLSEKSVPVTVVLADLDGLKAINDSFGHAAGDNAIRVTASALKESCPEDALCVRFGGDEMLAVICGPCNAIEIKAKIRKYLSDYNRRSSNGYKISASVGTYITNSAGDVSFEALVKASDSDMYVEKQSKKNK